MVPVKWSHWVFLVRLSVSIKGFHCNGDIDPRGDLNDISIFQANFSDWWLKYLQWICPQMNVTGPYLWNDDKYTLVHVKAWCHQASRHNLWDNVDTDLCHHMASLGHNELTHWPLRDVAVIFIISFITHAHCFEGVRIMFVNHPWAIQVW